MKLSAKARYAVRILIDLALHSGEGPVSTADIAAHTGVSVRFIEQILKPLKKDKLVRSTRGAAGGYVLAARPEDISLARVIRLIEGDVSLAKCCGHPDACGRVSTCSSHRAWLRVSRILEAALGAINIRDLMDDDSALDAPDAASPAPPDGPAESASAPSPSKKSAA